MVRWLSGRRSGSRSQNGDYDAFVSRAGGRRVRSGIRLTLRNAIGLRYHGGTTEAAIPTTVLGTDDTCMASDHTP